MKCVVTSFVKEQIEEQAYAVAKGVLGNILEVEGEGLRNPYQQV